MEGILPYTRIHLRLCCYDLLEPNGKWFLHPSSSVVSSAIIRLAFRYKDASCWRISRFWTLSCLRAAFKFPFCCFTKSIDLCRHHSYEGVYGGDDCLWLTSKQSKGHNLGRYLAQWGVPMICLRWNNVGGFGRSVTMVSMLFVTEASATLILAVDGLLPSLPGRWLMSETHNLNPLFEVKLSWRKIPCLRPVRD